jgi:high affinity sulfate transporter 1
MAHVLKRIRHASASHRPADRAGHRRLPVLQGIVPVDRKRIPTEIVAGVTLAALGIPEVLGYAKIAQVPVVLGLYTILVPIVVFALLGSSRHLVVGADSATAAILAAGLTGVATAGSPEYVALAAALGLATGLVLIGARLVRLGFLADFLSRSVLVGFLTGVGIQVSLDQVGGMLGVSSGSGGTLEKFFDTLGNLGDTSMTTLAVSLSVLVVIVGCRWIDRRIPGALIAVIGSIIVSAAVDMDDHGVSTLGKVPGGLPDLAIPDVDWHTVWGLTPTTLAIALVILAQSAATSRAYAARYQEPFSENVDLVGLGAANLAAGVTGTFVVNGSPTKTQMVDSAGGRSQLATVSTGIVVLVVLLFLTGPLQYLPNAVLAAVVFYIGLELIDIAGLREILAVRRDEFAIAALTALFVVVVGVEQAVVLAIVLSILDYVGRGYLPARRVVAADAAGRLHGADLTSEAQATPGLVVYRFGADLFYANAARFSEDVLSLARAPGVAWLCIDAAAMADIDFSGSRTMAELHTSLAGQRVRLVLADVSDEVLGELRAYGLLDTLGADGVFESVAEAISAYRATSGTPH